MSQGQPLTIAAPNRMRRVKLTAAAILIVPLATLVIAEITARAFGYGRRITFIKPEPPIYTPDDVIGWRPVPGRYRFGPYTPGSAAVEVTIRDDGARETGSGQGAGRPQVLLVGCSFTMGWAVADDDTWAWHLQQLRPDVEVVNRGVAGYGTLQPLLLLEQLLGRDGQRPSRVLYGFIEQHELRNVADRSWLFALAATPHLAATPYCTLTADHRLERHRPIAYPSMPLHRYLASMVALELTLFDWRAPERSQSMDEVTEQLIAEMAALCRTHGVDFSLVILNAPQTIAAKYRLYAEQHQIDVIDCNQQLTPGDRVPGDGHPTGAVHRRWGDCIAAALADPQRMPPPSSARVAARQ